MPVLAGEIVDAAVMRRARARRVPGRADRRRQGAGRPVLAAPEGDDDEGLRPDHLRPRGAGVLRRRVRRARDALERGANPNNGLAQRPRALDDCRRERGDRGRDRRRPTRPARRSRWSTPTAGSRTCTCRRDVIIDASMPAMIRTSGQMWNAAGEPQDTKAVIPDSSLRGAVRRDDRLLPRARRVRPGDDGHDAERRPDGAEGRGVRRRTTRRSRSRRPARCASSTRAGDDAARARRRGGRHLARLPDQGRAGPRLGAARGRARAGDRRAGRVLARRDARARRRGAQEGRARTSPSTTPTACRSRSCRWPRRRASRSSAPRAARTRSPSPATCCATTSPTCSRSSSSARARRCSRSCR